MNIKEILEYVRKNPTHLWRLTRREVTLYKEHQKVWLEQVKKMDAIREKRKTHFIYNYNPKYVYKLPRPDYKETRDIYVEFKAHYDEAMK